LREHVLIHGPGHLAAERIVALAEEGDQRAGDEEREHLARCPACHAELEWARNQPRVAALSIPGRRGATEHPERAALRGSSRGAPSRPLRSHGWWYWVLGGTAAAAIMLVVMFAPIGNAPPALPPVASGPPPLRLALLAHVEPLPVSITRAVAAPGSFEEAR